MEVVYFFLVCAGILKRNRKQYENKTGLFQLHNMLLILVKFRSRVTSERWKNYQLTMHHACLTFWLFESCMYLSCMYRYVWIMNIFYYLYILSFWNIIGLFKSQIKKNMDILKINLPQRFSPIIYFTNLYQNRQSQFISE